VSLDKTPPPSFLVHCEGDNVAIAVLDLPAGPVRGGYLAVPIDLESELREPISLGHKFALSDIRADESIMEYGVPVAVATRAIRKGEHVHVHNVRSGRWQHSVVN
jgi:(2R)-sulfolactate sulfo-lyase subunit alpha